MRERIQKLLAARGIGSRRQVEAWIVAGRIKVNGKLARPGQPVGEADDVRLDGRRLRLDRAVASTHAGMVYHRPAQEEIRAASASESASSLERLPRARGRRWIAISPLAANDGGLELFVTDGKLAAALTRRGLDIASEFSVRVRGAFDTERVGEILSLAGEATAAPGQVTKVTASGGEASNRWLQVHCAGLRPRDLRQLFDHCGLEANRILRTRFGPIAMDRALARGRSRPLTEGELTALYELAGLKPAGNRKPAR